MLVIPGSDRIRYFLYSVLSTLAEKVKKLLVWELNIANHIKNV